MALIAKDIINDPNQDLLILNGDFSGDASDQDHVQAIVEATPGAFKQYPLVGVGIKNYLGAPLLAQDLKRLIRVQLEGDGYKVDSIEVHGQDYYISGKRA